MNQFWNHFLQPAFDTLRPQSILEIGAGEGMNTMHLAAYASRTGASLTVIDPFPRFDVHALKKRFSCSITLERRRSLDTIPSLPLPDIVLADSDHNWVTVYGELKALRALAGSASRFPVVFVHDTGWPYGRRDMYAFPADIPASNLHPHAVAGVSPDQELLIPSGGLNARMYHALHEGGPRNGILTAVEDFLKEEPDIRLTSVSGLHGISILYPSSTLSTHPAFADFLKTLQTTPILAAHIDAVESDRVRTLIQVQELRRLNFRESMGNAEHRTRLKNLDAERVRLARDIARMQRTKSWKITAPLRDASVLFTYIRSPRSILQLFGNTWKALGSPFPGFMRFLRHRLLGRIIPALPSEVQQRQSLTSHVLSLYGNAPSLSVIVTARNNGPFLRDCLSSILDQGVRPHEIIYCDDGSTDDSLAIARSMHGVTVLPRKQEGVIAARNAAVKTSTGNVLLHVDGDDMLTPDFIAHQLRALAHNPDAVFAYGSAERFGIEGTYPVPSQPWNLSELWRQNSITTSSTIRRAAFEAAGGWQDGVGTLWDWHLWLRLSRIGHGVQTPSLLRYRRHIGSWSNATGRLMDDHETGQLMGRVRRSVARSSLCCIFGGRLPELLPLWMESIAQSIRKSIVSAELPELVVLDHSCAHMDTIRTLAEKTGVFRCVTVVPYREKFSWSHEMERRHKVAMFLAKAYNRLLAMADGEIVWFLEDDVVVPEHAYDSLIHTLTDGMDPPAAVSGLYRNRHRPDWIAHHADAHGHVLPIDISVNRPFPIDLAGTGCLMALRPFIPHTFSSHWRGFAPAHDWTWSEKIRRDGKTILLDPTVRCRHYSDLTNYV